MALVFYEVSRDEDCNSKQGELPAIELWQTPPSVGDEVLMGSSDRWQVVRVEPYRRGSDVVYLAFVSKSGGVSAKEEWSAHQLLQAFPKTSISICLTPDRHIVTRGWNMEGTPTSGQIENYESIGQGTLTKPVPTPWTVDRVDTYLPSSADLYSAIHLCWCKEIALELAA